MIEVPLSAELGLLHLLPPGYWLGLGLLVLAPLLAMREGSDLLVVVTGVLLLAVFAGTPALFESYPRYWDAYLHLSEAQGIEATGHLPAANIGQYSANWPGSFLLVTMVSQTAAIPAVTLLAMYPFLAGGLTFLAIFTFLRANFPRPVAGPGALLSAFFAVWAQYHLSPQSLGFVLVLLVLATVWRRGARMRALSALFFVGLVVSHPTSTLILLCILAVFTTFGLIWRPKSSSAREDARFARRVTLAYGMTWLAWLYFHATSSFDVAQTAILTKMGALVSLPEDTLNLAISRTAENLFTWAPVLRLGGLGVFGLATLAALFSLRRDEKSRPLGRFLLAMLVGLGIIAGSDILGFGGQFYDRCLLMFATVAPATALTGLRGVPMRKWFRVGAVMVLVAASASAASTVYYQEAFNLVTPEAVAVSQFLEQAPPSSVVVDGMYPRPVWTDPGGRALLIRIPFDQTYPNPLSDIGGPLATYAVFDRTAELWYRQWRGSDILRFYEMDRANYSCIYDNGRGSIYYVEG